MTRNGDATVKWKSMGIRMLATPCWKMLQTEVTELITSNFARFPYGQDEAR